MKSLHIPMFHHYLFITFIHNNKHYHTVCTYMFVFAWPIVAGGQGCLCSLKTNIDISPRKYLACPLLSLHVTCESKLLALTHCDTFFEFFFN